MAKSTNPFRNFDSSPEMTRRKRVQKMRAFTHWRWHLDEVYVKINGQMGIVSANAPAGKG